MGTIDLLKKLEESMTDECTCATDEEIKAGASSEMCRSCKIGNFLDDLAEEICNFIDDELDGKV